LTVSTLAGLPYFKRRRRLHLQPALLDFFGGGYVAMAVEQLPPDRVDTIADFDAVKRFGVQSRGGADAATAEVLAELPDLVARGELEVPIAGVFPLDDVRNAFRQVELRPTRGKLVLDRVKIIDMRFGYTPLPSTSRLRTRVRQELLDDCNARLHGSNYGPAIVSHRSKYASGRHPFRVVLVSYDQMGCCHGTFGQFRTQLGSGGHGREQPGKSGAIYAGA